LITEAKENMNRLPRYLSILAGDRRFSDGLSEKHSNYDRRPTKFEGKSTFGQLQGISLYGYSLKYVFGTSR
jgi:hypothetical protein